jgi:hypothetical protein
VNIAVIVTVLVQVANRRTEIGSDRIEPMTDDLPAKAELGVTTTRVRTTELRLRITGLDGGLQVLQQCHHLSVGSCTSIPLAIRADR